MVATRLRPSRILLVEDDLDHADLMRLALTRDNLGNVIAHVQDGQLALDYLLHHGPFTQSPRPDLVLLDINLPKLSGLEVLKRVKRDPSSQQIPVVMLSALSDETTKAIAYANGAAGYMVKRFGDTSFNLDLYNKLRYPSTQDPRACA